LMKRMSSLASLISATSAPAAAIFFGQPKIFLLLTFLAIIVFVRHKQNIDRIIRGVEPKIGKNQ
jgi:glycerol-3-phosphate acyltransferase PlsY